jgi:hypothetical protein
MPLSDDHEVLLEALRARATDPDPSRRVDGPFGEATPQPPASETAVGEAESLIGCPLHPLHLALLEDVGNGGFGPGFGLIGLRAGHTDGEGRSAVDLLLHLFPPGMPGGGVSGLLPLCDWGCGIWSCLDERTGHVLTLAESGLYDTRMLLADWLSRWLAGELRLDDFFEDGPSIDATDPFTREPMKLRTHGPARGRPFVPRAR